MDQLFKNLSINGEVLDILCTDGKIKKIGRFNRDTKVNSIDFRGKRTYAELVDIHTHGIVEIDTMQNWINCRCCMQTQVRQRFVSLL